MAAEGDLIDFEVIEGSKENIQSLPSGRSAKALAQIFSPVAQRSPSNTQDINNTARQDFEKELVTVDEADDPLDIYDRYVKWTLDSYPSAQATPQSQLLPLLERATKAFVGSQQYQNDPRYLKIWLQYINFFSDAPRETFAYLARHHIGESLALYYEEFAAWLETAGRWTQAEEVFKMGIQREAHPSARLKRKFLEFEQRYHAQPQDAQEPSSPALPAVRPALAAKFDPHTASTSSSNTDHPQAAGRAPTKGKKGKLEIFADNGEDSRPASNESSRGWENIGSMAERKKENVISAKPWDGEKMPSAAPRMGVPKMAIYKDEFLARMNGSYHSSEKVEPTPDHPTREQKSRNPRTGKLEHVFARLEDVYPNPADPTEEYCYEELRLARLSLLHTNWSVTPQQAHPEPELPRKKGRAFEIAQDETCNLNPEKVRVVSQQKTLALNDADENAENVDPEQAQKKVDLARQMRREERANRTRKIKVMETLETQTIQTNLNSPSRPKMKRKKVRDPTMTLHTKAATDEVYELFSAPLATPHEEHSESESGDESSSDEDDDYTSVGDSTTGRISATASEYGEETQGDLDREHSIADGEATETNNTGWTDFDPQKDLPSHDSEAEESTSHTHETTRETAASNADLTSASTQPAEQSDEEEEDVEEVDAAPSNITQESISPPDEDEEAPRTRYIPMPPEGYEAPTRPYRDPEFVAQSRLPFMTPIVEATESSFGAATGVGKEREENVAKTPCPKTSASFLVDDGCVEDDKENARPDESGLMSSPFTDDVARSPIPQQQPPPRLHMPEPKPRAQHADLSLRAKASVQQASSSSSVARPTAREKEQKGPVIKDLQVNPMDESVRNTILQEMQPSLESYDGFFYHEGLSSGRRGEIKKYCKAMTGKNGTTVPAVPILDLPGARRKYTIKRELGAGAYAPVYLVESSDTAPGDEENAAMHKGAFSTRQSLEALKSEQPPSAWEFYMLACAHRRLGVSRATASIVRAHEMHLFDDECFLIEDYRSTGTLLDLVNTANQVGVAGSSNGSTGPGQGIDETLAMFFAVELLRTVEALHNKNIIHGDLKPDNVLLRLDPASDGDSQPTAPYARDGSSGWSAKGISLIDLGRGIDTRQFLPQTTFLADWETTPTDCAEMREFRPWTYQIDYFGLAGILHTLLFGRYIDTVAEKSGAILGGGMKTYKLKEGLKRYWQTEIWAEVFAVLLNPGKEVEQFGVAGRLPVTGALTRCRRRMEEWLEASGERGMGLRGLVRRVEAGRRK